MPGILIVFCILALQIAQYSALGDELDPVPIKSQDDVDEHDSSIGIALPSGGRSTAISGEVALRDQGSSEDAPDLLADDGDGVVVRSKRYYGCGCFNCNCATMAPATYAPCGGCCGCGGYG
ncbi:hypothetical protein OSTOST_04353 [Ostertagia ostertagi]